jgi:hypothetical protein
MAAGKTQMNWTGTKFVETFPVAATLSASGVTGMNWDPQGSTQVFSGDGDRYPTTVVNDFQNPQVQVTSGDTAWVRAMAPGLRGTLSAILNDARNGAVVGGGGILFTLFPAVVVNNPVGDQHRQFAAGTVTVMAESVDGVTNPLSSSPV